MSHRLQPAGLDKEMDTPMSNDTVPTERHTRTRDPQTSYDAAVIEGDKWSELKATIILILAINGPLTDDTLYNRYIWAGYPQRTAQRVRTARKELQLANVVIASKLMGVSAYGRKSQKWELR